MVGKKSFRPEDALDRAVRAFWQGGYAGTSLQDVTAATGLGKGSLYATFGDKQQLFLACLDRYAVTVAARLLAALHLHPAEPRAALAAMYQAILTRLADPAEPPGCLISDTAAECAALPVRVQEAVRTQLDGQVAAVAAVLVTGRDRGALPPDADVRGLADHAVAVAQALAVLHRAGTPLDRLRGIVDTELRMVPTAAPARSVCKSCASPPHHREP